MHAYLYICMYVRTYACMQGCMHVCVYVCTCVYVCALVHISLYIYLHIFIYLCDQAATTHNPIGFAFSSPYGNWTCKLGISVSVPKVSIVVVFLFSRFCIVGFCPIG